MGRIGSKQCGLLIAAVVVLCLCVALCACDADDIKEFINPQGSITFVLNNGEENVLWHKGEQVPVPTLDGYKFVCWCADRELKYEAAINFETSAIYENLYLYAKWQKLGEFVDLKFESYEVTYDGLSHCLEVSGAPENATIEYSAPTEYVDAGVYEITATVKAEDYVDASLSATLTINKAKIEGVEFADKCVTWDGNAHEICVESPLPDGVSVSYDNNSQTEVGEHEITAHFDVGNNYLPIEDIKATLTIAEKTYNVTFVDCATTTTKTVGHGKNLTDVPTPSAKDGYAACWNTDNFENVTSDMTVSAVYTPIVYRVTYETFGGKVTGDTIFTIENGAPLLAATRDFYTFDGWYTDRMFSSKITEIGKGRVGDVTVYAKWTPVVYHAYFHLDGGSNALGNVNDGDSYAFTVESDTLVLAKPAKAFFDFEGWYTDQNCTSLIDEITKGTHGNLNIYAKWSPTVYKINYVLNGGENTIGPSEYVWSDTDIALAAPTREHYDFVGWFNSSNEKVECIPAGTFGDITLVAKWTAIKYSVTYHLFGGMQNVANPAEFTVEDKDISLSDPEKANYDFCGWYSDDAFTNKVDKIVTADGKSVELFAKWRATEFVIEFVGADVEKIVYTVESEDFALPCGYRLGYTFIAWFEDQECVGNTISTIKQGSFGNLKLYAKFTANEYRISYDLQGGVNSISNPTKYTIEDQNIVLSAPSRAHYVFGGWTECGKATNTIDVSRLCDISLVATWTAEKYGINYNLNGGSCEDTLVTEYTVESANMALPNLTKKGYAFDGWYDNAAFDGERVNNIPRGSYGNISLYAKFSVVEYAISYDLQGGVNSVSNPTKYTIEDQNIVLSAPSRAHYVFGGWTECGKATNTIDVSRLCDISLVATWTAEKYGINYNLNGGSCEDTLVTEYTVESANMALPNLTKKGYAFDGWYDNAAFDGERVNNIPRGSYGNISLYAKFSVVEYAISYDLQGGVNSVSNPTKYTIENQNIVLSAPSRECYAFDGWFENGSKVESVEVARCENVKLTAKWTAIEYTITYDLDGGVCQAKLPAKYSIESEDVILPIPSKDGCKFDGWYIGDKRIEKIEKGSHGDVTIVAKWRGATYAVQYVCDGNHDNPTELAVDEEYTLKDAEKTGYSFEGWHSDESLQTRVYTVISSGETVTLYAKFAPVTYTLTYDYSGGEGVENPSTYTVESEDIILNAASKIGFEFVGWFVGEEKIDIIKKGSVGDMTLVAKWQEISPFVVENGVVTAYSGDEKHVVVPETVGGEKITAIDENLLQNIANSVEIVEIQAKIETLPQSLFFNLAKLRILTLPSNIVEMPAKLLKDCVALEEVTLPFVGNIRYDADEFAQSDKTVFTFSYIFGDIQDVTFGNLIALNKIRYVKNGEIEKTLVEDRHYVPVSLKKVTVLGGDVFDYAFKDCVGIEEIVIGGNGKSVGVQAFAKCSDLKRIEFAQSYVNFGASCFAAIANPAEIIVRDAAQKSAIDNLALNGVTVKIANSVA